MDSKWPLIMITTIFLVGLGLIIASLEKVKVMSNWDTRRCDIPVMFTANFFKPEDDSRTSSEFASDNFSFCMKHYVDKTIQLAMSPLQTIFGKQVSVAGNGGEMISTLRNITSALYNAFIEILEPFYRRFVDMTHEVSRIAQHLRMAIRRISAVMMGMIWTTLTVMRGMLNSIDFIIKVVIIILSVLVALLIILFFVLFPFMPLIFAVIASIVTVAVGATLGTAVNLQSSFCFAENTKVLVKHGSVFKPTNVQDIKIGDELGNNYGAVTAVIKMSGIGVPLYDIGGIIVSGSHVVMGTDGKWKLVEEDERAILSPNSTSDILYCFNTETHNIPIISPKTQDLITFRDWEELPDDDLTGQNLWNYTVLTMLNNSKNYDLWKDSAFGDYDTPLVSTNTMVLIKGGDKVAIEAIKMNDIVIDHNGNETPVIGIVYEIIHNSSEENNKTWHTSMLEMCNINGESVWIRGKSTITNGHSSVIGKTLITRSGTFVIIGDNDTKIAIRDFTDVGYMQIQKTYSMIGDRLRLL